MADDIADGTELGVMPAIKVGSYQAYRGARDEEAILVRAQAIVVGGVQLKSAVGRSEFSSAQHEQATTGIKGRQRSVP
ncbi:MAG: hypothetical protein ISQ08_00875 [Planctomycetes bacterium]|nr:hypothetical protein [Planctomycetota bacterium]